MLTNWDQVNQREIYGHGHILFYLNNLKGIKKNDYPTISDLICEEEAGVLNPQSISINHC